MKKVFLFLGMVLSTVSVTAQEVEEPEFAGEVVVIRANKTSAPLEKQISQSRSALSAGAILVGIGKYKTQLQIAGCCSTVKLNNAESVKFIVRAVDNNTDPLAIIKIFKFESKSKYRRAEVASTNTFGTTKTNNLNYVSFSAKRYGKSSYIITPTVTLEPGEYGITVSNPNAVDEKQTVVSAFAVEK